MKQKITLVVMLLLFAVTGFTGNNAYAQSVTGTASTTNCLNGGIVTASSTGLGATPQYQLLKSGVVVAPVSGNASQFTNVNVFAGLEDGSYTIKARADIAGAVYTSANITVDDGYIAMAINTPTKTIPCATATNTLVTTISTGGKAPFTYTIALQSSPSTTIQSSGPITPTNFTFNPLSIGDYIISVTDNCGNTVTGATSITQNGVLIDGILPAGLVLNRLYGTVNGNCADKIKLNTFYGLGYDNTGTRSASSTDKANFTWRLEFNGLSYGQDIDSDGNPDLAGPDFLGTTNFTTLPGGITDATDAWAGNPKYILKDKCGNIRIFIPTTTSIQYRPINCGGQGQLAITNSFLGGGLACYPVNYTFTNVSNPFDVVTYSLIERQGSVPTTFTMGATYSISYIDASGATTGLSIATNITFSPTNVNYRVGTLNKSLFAYNSFGFGLNVQNGTIGDVITTTIIASTIPATIGLTNTYTLTQNGVNDWGFAPTPYPNNSMPAGSYTVQFSGPCGVNTQSFTATGYAGILQSLSTTPVCGGFNVVGNTTLVENADFYEIVVVSGPSNVGAVRNLASLSTSLPFNGLAYGTYVFGIRPKNGTVFNTQTVTYGAANAIMVDNSQTGGYVCSAGAINGTLTITAATNSPAPGNTLEYALSLDGGATYGAYQSANTFSGLTNGTYYFRVKDGCGNIVTQTAQLGVAATPTITADGMSTPVTFCNLASGTVQMDVDILGAASYLWTGPGITAANQNVKNPVINYADLTVGANAYTCTVTLGAPCNSSSVSTLTININALPAMVITNPATVCAPNTADLTASAVTAGSASGLTFTYYTDAAATTVLANPNAVSAGTYYIKGDNGTCSVIKPVTVVVNNLPVATISYGTVTKCASGTATVTQTGVTGGVYSSTTGLSLNTTTGAINLAASTPGSYTITYSFTDGTCSNTATANLTITAVPTLVITNPSAVCTPNTVDLTAASVTAGTTAGTTFTYFTNAAGTIALANPSAVSVSGTYYIKAGTGSCSTIQQVTVTINPSPTASISYSTAPICNRGTATVTLTGQAGGTYSGDSGLVINATTGAINLATSTVGTHTVTYNFSNGACTGVTTAQITIVATTMPSPLADLTSACSITPIAPTLSDACAGTLTATTSTVFPINASGTTVVVWTFNYGNGFAQTVNQNVIITPLPALNQTSTTTNCAPSGTGYTLTVTLTGTAPFTATGTGAPGTFAGNVWTSALIATGVSYNVTFNDANTCGSPLILTGVAPICCSFEVTCPTFPATTVACYSAIPTAIVLTETQFEALGNGNGVIGNTPCGVIEITASNAAAPTCEGNVTRTYTITEYADTNNNNVRDAGENTILNSTTCSQNFTIERLDFTMPANGSSTVACASAIIAPAVPVVTDNCGNVLTASAPAISAAPACEGNVTYTYSFTDCEGNTHDWVYTYTIERLDFSMPVNGASTVACASAITAPTVPVVTDNCGNVLTASAPVISSAPACEGNVTYTYTFTDCEGNTHNWVYTYTIERLDFSMPANGASTVACASAITAPTLPTVTDNCGNVLTASAPVISSAPACEGNVTYTYTFTDCEGNTHNWVYTYTIERLDFSMPANGSSTVACASAIATPAVPVVTDNCGNVLTASAPVISSAPACEGNVTYTYAFTDCEGNTHNWVYTYTIERLDFSMPANGASTVACASAITAPTVPVVTDNCGNILTASAPVISVAPACEGNVTYTYAFTDCEGNTHNWVYTYTIERLDFSMPANGASTVACAASIVAPTVPVVTDNCGNILTASAPVISAAPACEGNVTYTYAFTDCEGNTHNWVYTYTIERLDFSMPANGASTVACASAITAPTVPVVTDNCGNILTASAPVISVAPACEGNVTYTYTFTDCEGNTHNWVYTYTIERLDFSMPANGASTVACASAITAPAVPVVTDNCGNILTASAPVISVAPACEGNVTYTYTFTDCEGNTHNWVYTYTIERLDFSMPANGASTVACASAITAPAVPVVTDNCGNVLTASAPVISSAPACEGNVTYTHAFTDCEGNTHNWVYTYTIERLDFSMPANGSSTVACASAITAPAVPVVTDNCGNVLTASAPVISSAPACEGNVTYTYTFTDCEGNTHNWVYTYTIERLDFSMPANGSSTVACASAITAPAVPVVTDNCGNILTASAPVISSAPACEGNVTYTYAFTDCEGNTHNWVYTYTIERLDFSMPANGASTVACASAIATPAVPVVTDNCGNVLTASAPVISSAPACEGNVTYTYTFTDCEGNTHNWVYTYTLERLDFSMPANGSSTVACASAITAPTVPVITDNCGNILTASAPVISAAPACEGNVTYTYAFTDCEGNTHNWVYTYTIERLDFSMPANGASTVACASAITAPTVPVVTDNCGNVLTASAPVISAAPACEGNVTNTYTFTDCEGNTHDWVYTYTIERLDFTMPANGAVTVQCISEVVVPTVPVVTDNCGNILTASAPVISAAPACEGDVTYTYTFTDCEGNTHNWVYTYTIDDVTAPTGTAPANITLQCIDDVPAADIDAVTDEADNCSGFVTVTVSDTSNGGTGCTGNAYILTRTYTLTDCSGLSTNLVQTITVEDTAAPAFAEALPQDAVFSCDAQIPAAVTLTATDNCSFATVAFDEQIVNAGCIGNYDIIRTWTATDACGNETVHIQTIMVEDTTAPTFVEPLPENEFAECDKLPAAPVLTAIDNCGTASVTFNEEETDGSCSFMKVITRTWTATDDCGNSIIHIQKIDVSCPVIVYNALTPNEDGLNDIFLLDGIDCYPNNQVTIFNRWGVEVFGTRGYDNTSNVFKGYSEGRTTVSADSKLPTGTYFYILRYEFKVGETSRNIEKSGYLYINGN